ncbi:hypothetical protein [Pseudomonas sp. W5-01]|uniref:hypothetical protein n=1 Tax=Pseudomonas sp. W5-01 TaxID=3097454 RepID=UPI003978849E
MRVLILIVKAVLGIAGVVGYAIGFTVLLNSMAIVAHLADGFWFGKSIIGSDNAIAGIFAAVACGSFSWVVWHVELLLKPKMIEHQAR